MQEEKIRQIIKLIRELLSVRSLEDGFDAILCRSEIVLLCLEVSDELERKRIPAPESLIWHDISAALKQIAYALMEMQVEKDDGQAAHESGGVPAEKNAEYLEACFQRKGESAYIELPMPFDEDTFLIGVTVAGTSHCENIAEIYASLSLGDKLTLLREPDNEYDDRAILIRTADGEPFGYVPRYCNLILSRLMDAGYELYGKVRLLEICNEVYYHIVAKIYMKTI